MQVELLFLLLVDVVSSMYQNFVSGSTRTKIENKSEIGEDKECTLKNQIFMAIFRVELMTRLCAIQTVFVSLKFRIVSVNNSLDEMSCFLNF